MTMRPVYVPSERHVCYTHHRGCSHAVAIHTTPGDVYAFLRPIATFYLSAIAIIYRMPHSPHICLALRLCHILQYSLRFGYLACRCICFAIIVFYRSEIYSPIVTLSSTMPSVLHILRRSIIDLRCFFVLIRIRIRIVAILALIPVDITGPQVNPTHSALIHHRLAMLLPPHPHPHRYPHPHRRHPRPHTRRHHWFPGQTSRVLLRAVVAGWRWGWHRDRRFHHLHLSNPRCPLASRNEVRHQCNCCLSGCLGQCLRSQAPQAPLRRPNNQE